MNFKNVRLNLEETGFLISNADDSEPIATFYDAYDFSEVDVTIEDSFLTVYDKRGKTLMKATIYKNNQKPGEE